MFIVITGLDGSGTSSIAEYLHKIDKGSILLRTPSEEYVREEIDKNVRDNSQVAHYLFYLSSVVYMSDYIKKNLDYKNKNVYCVRYLIDTVVSHRVAGMNVSMNYSSELYDISKPDLAIFVDINESIRQTRISKRGKSHLDKVLDDNEVREQFLNEFKKNLKHENSIIININSENIQYIVKELYKNCIKGEEI